jgi:hypothetical protein
MLILRKSRSHEKCLALEEKIKNWGLPANTLLKIYIISIHPSPFFSDFSVISELPGSENQG